MTTVPDAAVQIVRGAVKDDRCECEVVTADAAAAALARARWLHDPAQVAELAAAAQALLTALEGTDSVYEEDRLAAALRPFTGGEERGLPSDPADLVSPEAKAELAAGLDAMARERRAAEVDARDEGVGR